METTEQHPEGQALPPDGAAGATALPPGPVVTPTVCIMGHSNEGKSSIISTLTENDSVRVDNRAGTTVECETFALEIDGQPRLRVVDTPGFENAFAILDWLRSYRGAPTEIVRQFCLQHHRKFPKETRALQPLLTGAAIMFVVDGSRPIDEIDEAEVEIIWHLGVPSIAILNCKEQHPFYLNEWKKLFQRHFKAVAEFNANTARMQDTIALLHKMSLLDSDGTWNFPRIIREYRRMWQIRLERSTAVLVNLLGQVMTYEERSDDRHHVKRRFEQKMVEFENAAHGTLRTFFRHNKYTVSLEAHSLFHEGLFSEVTWRLLGLTKRQLVAAVAAVGATAGVQAGASVDMVTGGTSFGLGSLVGAVLGGGAGAATAMWGSNSSLVQGIGSNRVRVTASLQLLYILLDRGLGVMEALIQWSHGRRDYPDARTPIAIREEDSFTKHHFPDDLRRKVQQFYRMHGKKDGEKYVRAMRDMEAALLQFVLDRWMATSE